MNQFVFGDPPVNYLTGSRLVPRRPGAARALLDMRYAAGEIGREEYLERRRYVDWGSTDYGSEL